MSGSQCLPAHTTTLAVFIHSNPVLLGMLTRVCIFDGMNVHRCKKGTLVWRHTLRHICNLKSHLCLIVKEDVV